MRTLLRKDLKENKANIILIVTNSVTFILILFFSLKMVAQEKTVEKIAPSKVVKTAFERDFPNIIAEWTENFGGDDLDHIRYNANFKFNNTEALAVYDYLGNLKVYEIQIQTKDIPSNVMSYLKREYKNLTINEASKVRNDKNEVTYEVGIIRDGKFYDVVFDQNGDFLEVIQKN